MKIDTSLTFEYFGTLLYVEIFKNADDWNDWLWNIKDGRARVKSLAISIELVDRARYFLALSTVCK